jgi:predicted phage-related endonuclease
MSVVNLKPPVRDPKWRMGFIGGSDAVKIMSGDWHQLWLEKTGQGEPVDLSDQFNVQLGTYTEDFNIAWFEHEYNLQVLAYQHEVSHKIGGIPFKATLDGVLKEDGVDVGLECKHTSSFRKFDDILAYYTPQIQLYMKVAKLDKMYLSVIFGNQWECKLVERSEDEWQRMLPILKDFWNHVVNKIPPQSDMPNELPTGVQHMTIDNMVARDASTDNEFRDKEYYYLCHFDDAQIFEDAKKRLKALIKPNEREVYTDKLSIKRNKRGALTIHIKEINDD